MSESASARVNYEKTPIYETLVDDYGVFGSYVDFFVFAATLGFNKGKVVREGYEGDNEMLWMHLQKKDLYRVVAASIAFQDTKDPAALLNPKKQLQILAQYAAGGAQIAAEEFGDVTGDPTDAVVTYLQANHRDEDQEEDETILSEIKLDFENNSPV
ncbi:hypothetical protein [Haladaptatus sp. ZSTT2]|uniref:hypothetical protein n=1 Tax=Haladaptatus sp. ZSTT2 TaxID=3120515 RepID=UPI00300F090F